MQRIATVFAAISGFALVHAAPADADTTYQRRTLGNVPGYTSSIPGGGIAFVPGSPNTLLIGNPNGSTPADGNILGVTVTRDPSTNRVTGFTGTPTVFASAPGLGANGALSFGPGGVLFYGGPTVVGQIKPGSTSPDKVVDLSATAGYFFTGGSINDLAFSPSLSTRAQMIVRYSPTASNFYEATFTPDGNGTYNISGPTHTQFFGGVVNFEHVPGGFPLLPAGSALVTGNNNGVWIQPLDADDRPAPGVDPVDLINATGAAFDPLTGDFLIKSLGTSPAVYAYTAVPEPVAVALLALAAVPVAMRRRSRELR